MRTPIHSRTELNEMLPQAEGFVASGAERILAQQQRVAELERSGRPARESKKLLTLMQETQRLQLGHVELLKRELTGVD
jgi:hypothetical protein